MNDTSLPPAKPDSGTSDVIVVGLEARLDCNGGGTSCNTEQSVLFACSLTGCMHTE